MLSVNSSNRNIKEFYVFRGRRLLNTALKDMYNKTGCTVMLASQIKNIMEEEDEFVFRGEKHACSREAAGSNLGKKSAYVTCNILNS